MPSASTVVPVQSSRQVYQRGGLVTRLLSPHIRTEPASVDLPSSCRCARLPPQITASSIHFCRHVHCFYSDASVRGDGLVTAASCWDGRSVPLVILNGIIGFVFVLSQMLQPVRSVSLVNCLQDFAVVQRIKKGAKAS